MQRKSVAVVPGHIERAVPNMRPDVCHTDWPFLARGPRNRPRLLHRGKTTPAVHYAWFVLHGRWPEGQLNHGDCHNPECWNPHHVYEGSQLENIADMIKAGRHNVPRGEKHCRAQLTDEQVRAIRAACTGRKGEQVELARAYGVSSVIINNILRRRTRKHI